MALINEKYENDKYRVTIKAAPYYSIDSTDNKKYDLCINACEDAISGHYCCYEMEVLTYESWEVFSIILVASNCTKVFEKSGSLRDDTFWLILNSVILKINLGDFTYVKHLISKSFGSYYEIYPCDRGFLVYGELELVLFDEQFAECWRYATQDILFGGQELILDENGICFEDFEGNYHEVDWYGNQRKYEKYKPKT